MTRKTDVIVALATNLPLRDLEDSLYPNTWGA